MKKCMDYCKKIPLPLAIIIAGALITVAIFVVNNQKLTNSGLPAKEAGDVAIKYINDVLLQKATTKGVLKEVKDAGGIYGVSFDIGDKNQTIYLTKDGKMLMPLVYELKPAETTKTDNTQQTTTPATTVSATKCEDLKKVDKPMLETFIVSSCPYGLQMQRVVSEAVNNIPEMANYVKMRYIGSISGGKITSMHGDAEAVENLNQICIREEQPTKYWPYVSCYIKKSGSSAECLASVGVDQAKLSTCTTDANKGLKYAAVDFDLTSKNKIKSSPTLMLNAGSVDASGFGGRTANAIKSLLCCSFSNKPAFCSKTLVNDAAAAGFSPTYKASGSATQNSNVKCGQ